MIPMTLKLAQLRFGHDPLAGPEINARRTGRMTDVPQMAAMLASQGQISRLLVVMNPTGRKEGEGLYFAVDGNRRLAAMQDSWEPDAAVLVDVAPDAKSALEKSVAANTSLPLHPVDRYRAYIEVMKRDKLDGDALARRFGTTSHEMRKSLALGGLDDSVLDAWLAGAITADAAQAFTLAADKKQQASVLANALKQGGTWYREPNGIRQAIIGKAKDVGKLIEFVGITEFVGAGGKLVEDLFGTAGHVTSTPQIAVKLAKDRLAKLCKDYVAAGWAWAEAADDMPSNWKYGLGFSDLPTPKMPKLSDVDAKTRARLKDAAEATDNERDSDSGAHDRACEAVQVFDSVLLADRGYTAEAKATAGVVLEITDFGQMMVTHGKVKPSAKKAAAKATAPKKKASADGSSSEPAAPATIPQSLAHSLSRALTKATANVVREATPSLIVRLALVALTDNGAGAVGLRHTGMGSRDDDEGLDFLQAIKATEKLELPVLISKLGDIVAKALDFQTHNAGRLLITTAKTRDGTDFSDDEVTATLGLMPQGLLQAAIRAEFDAAEFFKSAPAAFAKQALAEMNMPVPPKFANKGELVNYVAPLAANTGWLPVQLRTATYDGPKAKAKAAAETAPAKTPAKAGTKADAKKNAKAAPKAKKKASAKSKAK